MAKQYEEYKKSFEQIQKKIQEIAEDIKKNANFVAQTSGIIKEGAKEVGNRIQELKDKGQTGNAIKDFEGDVEVKKMLASIESYMKGLEKELKRIKAVHDGESTKTRALFWSTKKEASTKLGLGNKSLPDMEKLLKEMDKYPDQMPYAGVDVFVPEDIAQHRKELERDLAAEVKQAKDVKLTAEQKMLDEQALNIRNLTHNVSRAKLLCEGILKTCAEAEKALEARNQKALMTAKAEIPKPLKELGELASIGERALKDSWIKKGIETSKDKAKILAGIKAIAQFKTDASEAVKKVANARL